MVFSFSFRLISLSVIISSCICVTADGFISFFLMAEQHSIVCIYLYYYRCIDIHTHQIFIIHSSVSEYLSYFHVFATINSTVMNIGVSVYFQIRVSSGYMPRNRIAGSYDNSIFSFLRNLYVVFHIGNSNVHSYQHCRGFIFLYTLSSICYLQFLMMALLIGVKWYLIVVWVFFCLFVGSTHSMWKFPVQGSNLYHSSNPSHSNDKPDPQPTDTRELHIIVLICIRNACQRLIGMAGQQDVKLAFFQKRVKNTSTCATVHIENLLNAGRRLQTSERARKSPYNWIGQNKRETEKEIGMRPVSLGGNWYRRKVPIHWKSLHQWEDQP